MVQVSTSPTSRGIFRPTLILLTLGFSAILSGAITDVQVAATSTQAWISYSTTSTDACTIEVRENSFSSPVVNDVDPTKFTGANLDSRAGSVQTGYSRGFVAGKRTAERGVNSVLYSRALQTATSHVFKITCDSDVYTGQFTTLTIPFGQTYMDPIPPDPDNPGEVRWPQLDYSDRTKSYVDPQTGALLKRLSGPSDVYDPGPSYTGVWASPYIDTYPSKAAGWTAKNLPTSITNNATGLLLLRGGGAKFWGFYPLGTTSNLFTSEATGNLNYFQVTVTAQTSNSACGTTDNCKIVACLSTDGATCHPYSRQIEQALTNKPLPYTFGDMTYVNQGGWITPGKRWLSGPETMDFAGTATCVGSAIVTGGPFNLTWGLGSQIVINGVTHIVASVQHEAQITLMDSCPAGTWSFTASNFSVLVRAKIASADTITIQNASVVWAGGIAPQWPAGAFWDLCGSGTVTVPNDGPGYTCLLPTFQGFYWVNASTGESRLIGKDDYPNYACFGNSDTMDALDPTKYYCSVTNGLQSFKYVGNFTDQVPGFHANTGRPPNCAPVTNPTNQPCYLFTDIAAGTSLPALLQDFDPTYQPSKYPAFFLSGVNQLDHLLFRVWRTDLEQTPMWTILFDPNATTNGQPGNAGCVSTAVGSPSRPGCVIAAMPNWLRSQMRGQATKGDIISNVAPGWVSMQPYFWNTGPSDGAGPWQVTTPTGFTFSAKVASGSDLNEIPGGLNQCPSNSLAITGKQCTQVLVSGEPYDPTPGPTETGLPGEYMTTQPGDLLFVNGNNYSQSAELLRLVLKQGNLWTFQRGATNGTAACNPVPQYCPSGGPVQASTPNPILSIAASSPRNYWNYVKDPHGNSVISDQHDSRNHGFSRFGSYVESVNGVWDPRCINAPNGCYGIRYQTTLNDVTTLLNLTPRTNVVTHNPSFNGKSGFGDANAVQTHPSGMGYFSTAEQRRYFVDARPFNGQYSPGDPTAPLATLVTGHLWKFPATGNNALALDRKFLATKAQSSWHPLVDVSGPGSLISGGLTDRYKYCVVVSPGECSSGSVTGEVYFNVPFLQFNYCLYPGQATPGADNTDVCIQNEAMVQDSILQVRMDGNPDTTGDHQRVLTRGLALSKMNPPFWNISVLPNSQWGIFRSRFINGFRTDAMLIKIPPGASAPNSSVVPEFVPIQVFPDRLPSQTNKVLVEFGYAENGPATSFFCTSRQEACATGRASESSTFDPSSPFYYEFREATFLPGTPCANGCAIWIPAIPDRVLYYRFRYRDAKNNDLGSSEVNVVTTRPNVGVRAGAAFK